MFILLSIVIILSGDEQLYPWKFECMCEAFQLIEEWRGKLGHLHVIDIADIPLCLFHSSIEMYNDCM